MTTLHLTTNSEINRELLEEYFSFKWNQKLKKEVFIRGSILALVIFTILFIFTKNLFFFLASMCAIIFIIYSTALFFSVKRMYLRSLKQSKTEKYQFTYSETGLSYKLPNKESNYDWAYFKCYEENGDSIYLFDSTGKSVIDIISEKKFGIESFSEIRKLILSNVPKK